MRRLALAGLIQVTILFFLPDSFSKERDLSSTIEKKQSVISGVLNPGSVSFNGQEIYNGKENFSALLVNKEPVKINSVFGLQTFYFNTDETSLELEWRTLDGKNRPLLKVEYPALTEFKTDANNLYFTFNGQVSGARMDSQEINLQEINLQDSMLQIDNFKTWINEGHTLELVSKKNVGQIYNLDFKNLKSDLLTTMSISFSVGDGPFSANEKPTAFGLSVRLLNEYNYSFDCGVYLSKVDYNMGSGNFINGVTQSAGQLKARLGYNPFEVNFGGFSFRRLTFGAQSEIINYKRKSDFASNIDGQDTDIVSLWYLQGGPFLRWEPVQYKDWGFFLNFDFRVFRTQSNISSDGDVKTFGLSYYY